MTIWRRDICFEIFFNFDVFLKKKPRSGLRLLLFKNHTGQDQFVPTSLKLCISELYNGGGKLIKILKCVWRHLMITPSWNSTFQSKFQSWYIFLLTKFKDYYSLSMLSGSNGKYFSILMMKLNTWWIPVSE